MGVDKRIDQLRTGLKPINGNDLLAMYQNNKTVNQPAFEFLNYIKSNLDEVVDNYTVSASLSGSVLSFDSNNLGQSFYSVDLQPLLGLISNETYFTSGSTGVGSITSIPNKTNSGDALGDYSFIAGGTGNTVNSTNSTIISGVNNRVLNSLPKTSNIGIPFDGDSTNSAIIGGEYNTISGHTNALIGGGSFNTIDFDLEDYFDNYPNNEYIIGGQNNYVSSQNSGIIGGIVNKVLGVSWNSSIFSGTFNQIQSSSVSTILGGSSNSIQSSDKSNILGGDGNLITESSNFSSIFNSRSSITSGTTNSMISNSFESQILGADYSSIIGSSKSQMVTNSDYPDNTKGSTIIGGNRNSIFGFEDITVNTPIGSKTLDRSASSSSIIGGSFNMISGHTNSFIGGGENNTIDFDLLDFTTYEPKNEYIIGGSENYVSSANSGVLGGKENSIINGSDGSSVLGGGENRIVESLVSTVIGGVVNTIDTSNVSNHPGINNIFGSINSEILGKSNSSTIINSASSIINTDDNLSNFRNTIINGYQNFVGVGQPGDIYGQNNNNTLINNDTVQLVKGVEDTTVINSENITVDSVENSTLMGVGGNITNSQYLTLNGMGGLIDNSDYVSTLGANFYVTGSSHVMLLNATDGRIFDSQYSSIYGGDDNEINNGSENSNIIGSVSSKINDGFNNSIIGGIGNEISFSGGSVSNSVILGGSNLRGTNSDTVYVPKLNVNKVPAGTSVNNLGIDIDGNVVIGSSVTSGSSEVRYVSNWSEYIQAITDLQVLGGGFIEIISPFTVTSDVTLDHSNIIVNGNNNRINISQYPIRGITRMDFNDITFRGSNYQSVNSGNTLALTVNSRFTSLYLDKVRFEGCISPYSISGDVDYNDPVISNLFNSSSSPNNTSFVVYMNGCRVYDNYSQRVSNGVNYPQRTLPIYSPYTLLLNNFDFESSTKILKSSTNTGPNAGTNNIRLLCGSSVVINDGSVHVDIDGQANGSGEKGAAYVPYKDINSLELGNISGTLNLDMWSLYNYYYGTLTNDLTINFNADRLVVGSESNFILDNPNNHVLTFNYSNSTTGVKYINNINNMSASTLTFKTLCTNDDNFSTNNSTFPFVLIEQVGDDENTSGGVTVSNGLTEVGNDIQLGGDLTKNTTISAKNGNYLTIDSEGDPGTKVTLQFEDDNLIIDGVDSNSDRNTYVGISPYNFSTSSRDTGVNDNSSNLDVSPTSLQIQHEEDFGPNYINQFIRLDGDGIEVRDQNGNNAGNVGQGLFGTFDYSPNYTPLSYVQKAYVDRSKIMESGLSVDRPSSPEQGQQYLDTTIGLPIVYNGSDWIDYNGNVV